MLKVSKFSSINSKLCQSRHIDNLQSMSESLEIVEITDSSIITDTTPELKDSLQNATKTKRQLDTSDELFDEQPLKKICTELEDSTQVVS